MIFYHKLLYGILKLDLDIDDSGVNVLILLVWKYWRYQAFAQVNMSCILMEHVCFAYYILLVKSGMIFIFIMLLYESES